MLHSANKTLSSRTFHHDVVFLSPGRAEADAGGCQLTLTLHSELVADADAAALFPFNALRNAAMLLVRTSLVAVVDGDMLISHTLSAQLSTPAGCV